MRRRTDWKSRCQTRGIHFLFAPPTFLGCADSWVRLREPGGGRRGSLRSCPAIHRCRVVLLAFGSISSYPSIISQALPVSIERYTNVPTPDSVVGSISISARSSRLKVKYRGGRTASVKWASTRASRASVFANLPVGRPRDLPAPRIHRCRQKLVLETGSPPYILNLLCRYGLG